MTTTLRTFRFRRSELVVPRIRCHSVLDALENGGLDGAADTLRRMVREAGATLLVVDGVSVIEDIAPSALEFRRFTHRLQVLSALLGCTTLLLSNARTEAVDRFGTQVDGVILLRRSREGTRAVRLLEVAKLRGADHLDGRHEFDLTANGIVVFPRIEGAFAGSPPPADPPPDRLGFGLPGIERGDQRFRGARLEHRPIRDPAALNLPRPAVRLVPVDVACGHDDQRAHDLTGSRFRHPAKQPGVQRPKLWHQFPEGQSAVRSQGLF